MAGSLHSPIILPVSASNAWIECRSLRMLSNTPPGSTCNKLVIITSGSCSLRSLTSGMFHKMPDGTSHLLFRACLRRRTMRPWLVPTIMHQSPPPGMAASGSRPGALDLTPGSLADLLQATSTATLTTSSSGASPTPAPGFRSQSVEMLQTSLPRASSASCARRTESKSRDHSPAGGGGNIKSHSARRVPRSCKTKPLHLLCEETSWQTMPTSLVAWPSRAGHRGDGVTPVSRKIDAASPKVAALRLSMKPK
mmetsp:Transcript_9512/g.27524  ORF Transcript_9512/g.27524 Transcript_9512/m.27524 type:complete len:252 (+) Transcript_9512:388-1143(+)